MQLYSARKSSIAGAVLTALLCGATQQAKAAEKNRVVSFSSQLRTGLVLHLDASNAATLERDVAGRVTRWRDLSPAGHHATLGSAQGPQVVPGALNGRAVLRFGGREFFKVPALSNKAGGLSVFAVFRRLENQASERRWQRVLSGWDGLTPNDNAAPSFLLDTSGTGKAMPATILSGLLPDKTYRGAIEIGRNAAKKGEFLEGDLAEILIYDRSFLTYEPIQAINEYFVAKWGVKIDTETDWTRAGPLPAMPKRQSETLPLSDQKNTGKWARYETLWDEFNGPRLDETKWWDHNPNWYGRAPSRYVANNVTVQNGELGITMSLDKTLPEEKLYPNGEDYHSYAAASVVSKSVVRYGYFEIRAKAMNSAASSAFWFTGRSVDKNQKTHQIEIDVFEIGGAAPGFENKYNMNAHIFKHPDTGEKHWNKGGSWRAPFRLADEFHIYGLEWTPDFIRFYVDSVLVRSQANTHWKAPMRLLFDTETMGNWLGMPKDAELPATFRVDYVRAWKSKATKADWTTEFTLPDDPTKPTKITEYVNALKAARVTAKARDWDGIPVPVTLPDGQTWRLQETLSDDFNYEAPTHNKGAQFAAKWTDFYHNNWTGPGLTMWDRSHVFVADGKLQFKASRVPDSNKVYLGCVTSKERVQYPVYVEARAKIANSVLASDVWMLSPDDTQEIDIIEAYGASRSEGAKKDQTWYAERIHLSHHVFIRNPFQDYQPTDAGSWYRDGTLWRDNYHRVGVYWRDPWHLEYYVNGKLVRTASGKEMIDPKDFTRGTGLNKAMDIIINMEDQTWRSNQGLTPTDEELKNRDDHTFKVDWIRVYKPIDKP